ncbi:hypothetical protein DMC64_17915 [Amycolatopsis sp. WAC 04197]|nr:hypothetical protein DMC64_17915 [Amycolatopsis sp. WAC 04197]
MKASLRDSESLKEAFTDLRIWTNIRKSGNSPQRASSMDNQVHEVPLHRARRKEGGLHVLGASP